MIRQSPLARAVQCNGQVACDCKNTTFEVGVAVNVDNGNSFIRVLQCTKCAGQMLVTHKSSAGLEPALSSVKARV